MPLAQEVKKAIALLAAPAGTTAVRLHKSKKQGLFLLDTSKRTLSDGQFVVKRGDDYICFALQSEKTTGQNVQSLIGKAAASLVCNGAGKIAVDIESPPVARAEGSGRQQTEPQSQRTRIARLAVVFIREPKDERVGHCVEAVVSLFQACALAPGGSAVFSVSASVATDVAKGVQKVIDQFVASLQAAQPR